MTDALWVTYLCCLLDLWFNADKYPQILHHLGEFPRVRLAFVLHIKHKTHGQAVLGCAQSDTSNQQKSTFNPK